MVELTKKGQPHLHIVALRLEGSKGVLEREAREAWYEATGDSYIVDVRPITSKYGIGFYLGKYLEKGFAHREEMVDLGFLRRWSASGGWPRAGKLTLTTETGEVLSAVEAQGYKSSKQIANLGLESEYEEFASWAVPRIRGGGDELVVALGDRKYKKRMKKWLLKELRKGKSVYIPTTHI